MPTTEFGQMLSASLADVDLSNPINYSHPLAKGLVGFWLPLPSLAGGMKLYDLTRYRNHGTLTNMDPRTDWVQTERGIALDFDGNDDFVEIGDQPLLRFTGDFTLTWLGILPSSGPGSSALIGKVGTNRACGVQFYLSDKLYLWYASDISTIGYLVVTFTPSRPDVDLLCAVFRAGKSVALYQNGVMLAEDTSGIPASFFNDNSLPWCLQTRGDKANKTGGRVVIAAMHARALRPHEIRNLYVDPIGVLNRRRFWYPKSAAAPTFQPAWAAGINTHVGLGV